MKNNKNKKQLYCISTITILSIMLLVIMILTLFILKPERKPFKTLNVNDVNKIELLVQPPNKTVEIIDNAQIQKIIDILNQVVIYKEDDSWSNYDGQHIQYTLTMKNGEITKISALNPFLCIDGIGYRTKYQPCEDLNALANSIIE